MAEWLNGRLLPGVWDGRKTSRSPAFGLPLVNMKVASILTALAPEDSQLIPVDVGSQHEPHFIRNALRVVKCIDDAAWEEAQHWMPEDGRPERVGTYRAVYGMRIDPWRVIHRPNGHTLR